MENTYALNRGFVKRLTSLARLPLMGYYMHAEIKVPSVENPKLSKVLSSKPGAGQNIAMHASPTARNFFLSSTSRSI